MFYQIRKYKDSDRENLNEICIKTAIYFPIKNPNGRFARALSLMFADYYAVCEKENCFVLANENDETKGYVLCALNFDEFKSKFKAEFGKPLRKIGLVFYISQLFEFKSMSKFAKEFPAHLHIDLLPECQAQGFGSALIETLEKHLKTQNVKGVMLGCVAKNIGAIKFYKKLGFIELKRTKSQVIMGKTLVCDATTHKMTDNIVEL